LKLVLVTAHVLAHALARVLSLRGLNALKPSIVRMRASASAAPATSTVCSAGFANQIPISVSMRSACSPNPISSLELNSLAAFEFNSIDFVVRSRREAIR